MAKIPIEQVTVGYTADGKHSGPASVQAVIDFMEQFLTTHPISAADIMMQFVPNAAKLTAGFDTANFPLIQAWLKKVEARSAYERALARAVPGGANE